MQAALERQAHQPLRICESESFKGGFGAQARDFRLLHNPHSAPSAGALAREYHSHGLEHDQQIKEERVVLDIVEVVLQLLDRILDR